MPDNVQTFFSGRYQLSVVARFELHRLEILLLGNLLTCRRVL